MRSFGFILTLGTTYAACGSPADTDSPPPEGPTPDIDFTPDRLSFGEWTIECPAEPVTVTVANVGDTGSTLTIADLTVADASAAFGIESAATASLAVGDTFEFQVWFQPSTSGPVEGAIDVSCNDPDEGVAVVGLDGVGVDAQFFDQMDRFEQAAVQEVDVLFVVDNSCSMADEQDVLGRSFAPFVDNLEALNVEYHIAVTSTAMSTDGTYDPPLAGKFTGAPTILDSTSDAATVASDFAALVALGNNGTGDEKGLDAAYAALTSPLITGYNSGFLRPEANLQVIVLSDEPDASTLQPADFSAWLDATKPNAAGSALSAITGLVPAAPPGIQYCDPNNKLTSNTTQYGQEYVEVAEATGGDAYDICASDWTNLITALARTTAGLHTAFSLSLAPSALPSITVLVQGQEVPYGTDDGWTFDADHNQVRFHGNSIPGPDEDVVVTYQVESAQVCEELP